MLDDDDLAYLRRQARVLDSSGEERKRQNEHAAFERRAAEERRQKEQASKQAALEKTQRLAAVKLVAIEDVEKLKVVELDLQLEALQKIYSDTEIPKLKKDWGKKRDKADLLTAALQRHSQIESAPQTSSTSLSDPVIDSWTHGYDELEREMIDGDEDLE